MSQFRVLENESTKKENSAHPSPSTPIHRLLLVLNRLRHNLSVEVIVKHRWELGLDGESLGEELLVELLPVLLEHENASRVGVLGRSTGSSHHLQEVRDGVVGVSMILPIEVLNSHDDDHVRSDGESPGGVLEEKEEEGKGRSARESTRRGRTKSRLTFEATRT